MFNVEEFEQWINQKQHGRKIEEDLQLLSPDVATDQDMFGYVSLHLLPSNEAFQGRAPVLTGAYQLSLSFWVN